MRVLQNTTGERNKKEEKVVYERQAGFILMGHTPIIYIITDVLWDQFRSKVGICICSLALLEALTFSLPPREPITINILPFPQPP
jgi:cell division protein FtsW (lipid II flippase)